MLTHLLVQNVALVDQLELQFGPGMTVVTGETGAGKSILLNALGLALGDRAESGLIAAAADRAEVHATFDVDGNPRATQWLLQREFASTGEECILRRIVGKDGRSRGFINGFPATVADMKALGDILIDIHSQHEHHSLLQRDTHRRLLDEFGDNVELATVVSATCAACTETKRQLEQLVTESRERSARQQLLTYQTEELATLGATAKEVDELADEQKRLANAEEILKSCSEALAICSEEDSTNVLDQLIRAIQLLSAIDLGEARAIVDLLESARIQIDESTHDITRLASSIELDPQRLADVEARLSDLYEMARKHRIEPHEIPDLEARLVEELRRLGNADEEISNLQQRLAQLSETYVTHANKLSKARRKAAGLLCKRVVERLTHLGMQGAAFDVSLVVSDTATPRPSGLEDIEFLISTNPGQAPRPLNRIASGGELSRISLAIQVVTADTSKVPTLIFDEVDVGIGGAIAEVVGTSLRQLGSRAQIICVTHLPQVAAQGHHHLRVTKVSHKSGARTGISELRDRDKVEEIARMLGGVQMTPQSLAHAEEMFEQAQQPNHRPAS